MEKTTWIEINQSQPTDMTFWTSEESQCFLRGPLMEGECRMLPQSMAMQW